jgi:hypothetical protein
MALSSVSAYSRDFSVGDIKHEYAKCFHARVVEGGISLEVDSLPKGHFLAGLINEHHLYALYILNNCAGGLYTRIGNTKNKAKILKAWDQFLNNDSLFNANFLRLASWYLKAQGDSIAGYDMKQRSSVSESDVREIATHFFYPHYIESFGQYATHICVGINGMSQLLPEKRDYAVEAFCYSAVFPEAGDTPLMDAYDSIFKTVSGSGLPEGRKEHEHALQTGVWSSLRERPELKDVLTKKYNNMKEILPFVVQQENGNKTQHSTQHSGMGLLTLLILIPLAGAALLHFVKDAKAAKIFTLTVSIIAFATSLCLYFRFDNAAAGYQFVEKLPWVSSPGIELNYHIGVGYEYE